VVRKHLIYIVGAVGAAVALGCILAASFIGGQCEGWVAALTLLAMVVTTAFGWPLFFYLLSRGLWAPRWKPDALQSLGLLLLCWYLTAYMLLMAPSAADAPPYPRFIIGVVGFNLMIGLPFALIFARLIARLLGRKSNKSQNSSPAFEPGCGESGSLATRESSSLSKARSSNTEQ